MSCVEIQHRIPVLATCSREGTPSWRFHAGTWCFWKHSALTWKRDRCRRLSDHHLASPFFLGGGAKIFRDVSACSIGWWYQVVKDRKSRATRDKQAENLAESSNLHRPRIKWVNSMQAFRHYISFRDSRQQLRSYYPKPEQIIRISLARKSVVDPTQPPLISE